MKLYNVILKLLFDFALKVLFSIVSSSLAGEPSKWGSHMMHRGSYTSAHVLLNFLNELRKSDKMRGFFAASLINSIIQEREC